MPRVPATLRFGMGGPTKEKRVWCYVSTSDDAILQRIAKRYNDKLTEPAILSVILSAALKAADAIGCALPSKFTAEESENNVSPRGVTLNEKGKRGK